MSKSSTQTTEKRPGHPAKSSRTAHSTDTLEGVSAMTQSTPFAANDITLDDHEIAETVKEFACLVVPTHQGQSNVHVTTSDVFHDGVKVNPRVTIVDGDGQDVWLDLPADDIEAIGEWLIGKAQEMQDGAL